MRRLVLLVAFAALVPVAACGERPVEGPDAGAGGPASTASGTAGATPDLGAALDGWRQFPVDRRPRPIVLLESLPRVEGFTTDEAKIAAMQANYELAAALPVAPPTVTAQLPGGAVELPALPAEQAYGGLRSARTEGPPPNPTDALPITRVELGTARFLTDRGHMTLPSWLFHAVDALGPIAWPAPRPDAFWRLGELAVGAAAGNATLSQDGRMLTVRLPAPPDPCPGEPVIKHEPVVVESASAVAVGVRQVVVSTAPGPPPVTGCARLAILRFEPHQVQLATPLGDRVLIDERGAPTPVG